MWCGDGMAIVTMMKKREGLGRGTADAGLAALPGHGPVARSCRRSFTPSHRHGFTLIELIITVAIVAILASAVLPLSQIAVQRGKEQELRTALRDIRTAIDAYKQATDEGRVMKKADQSGFPPTLAVLVTGVEDAKSPEKRVIYFLRRLPRDPFAPEHTRAEDSWGKRAYASPPDNPQEGNDVFDVFSRSPGVGLNGVAYKEW
jgi:general secretion pathway protein G